MRKNTVTWVDGKVLTKLMGELQGELMSWQMEAYETVTCGEPCRTIGGDRGVLVAAINLRNKLDAIIEKSAVVNAPKSVKIS
jgi:hypothetical protein